jgi:hypothetical protein
MKKPKLSEDEILQMVMKQLRRLLFLHWFCLVEMVHCCCRYMDWLGFRVYCLLQQEILEYQNKKQVIKHSRDPLLLSHFYAIRDFHWFDLLFNAIGMLLSLPVIFVSAITAFFGTAIGILCDKELMEYIARKADPILTQIRLHFFPEEGTNPKMPTNEDRLQISEYWESPEAALAA